MAGERRRWLAAHVMGYSWRVGADEEGTLARPRTRLDKAAHLGATARRGRVVSEPRGRPWT